MIEQDNEAYRDRVSQAVLAALLDASRDYPGSANGRIRVSEALDGMCEAMAGLVATIAQVPADRDEGARLVEDMEGEIVERLRFFAQKIRAGDMRPPPGPPELRLVD